MFNKIFTQHAQTLCLDDHRILSFVIHCVTRRLQTNEFGLDSYCKSMWISVCNTVIQKAKYKYKVTYSIMQMMTKTTELNQHAVHHFTWLVTN